MELKKNSNVNLEKAKGVFFLIGAVVAMVIIIGLFAWTSEDTAVEGYTSSNENIEIEQVDITQQEKIEKPKPKQEKQVSDKIEIVEDKVIIKDIFNFNLEPTDEPYDFIDIDNLLVEEIIEVDPILPVAEKMPKYPGGEAALRAYIAENVEYPEQAKEADIQGTVYVRFVVTKTGNIGEVTLLRGVDPLLDNASLAVVKTLPKFTPGEQRGKKVSVWYTVPITFQLSN